MTQGATTADPPTKQDQEEFDRRYQEADARERANPPRERFVDGKLVVWAPQPGSQDEFLSCPLFECLYHGTRGPGKTDSLLMSFTQYVGRGFGSAWRGILFRETFPQLADVVAKSEKWFRRLFPGAEFNRQRMEWRFPDGEILRFAHMRRPETYWDYHGHEYPWIGWEELTNWADDECYRAMMSCCRSSTPGLPRMIRATTNPYGVGHNWVKDRFRLWGEWWRTQVITDATDLQGNLEPPRAAIHGHIDENRILLDADPNYKQTIAAAARNKAMLAAWLDGSWKIVAGGMFGPDVWSYDYNVLPRFAIPRSWRIDRAFDWGSSAPFSVGWYAESDGSDFRIGNRIHSSVSGDLFRIREWYGWTGRPNQGLEELATNVSKGIVERELAWGWRRLNVIGGGLVEDGPADSAIFAIESGRSIALDMEQPVRVGGVQYEGITWTPADKRPGSRISGWEQVRTMMRNAWPNEKSRPREHAGLFVVGDLCPQFLRTVLSLPRDERKLDDVDTNAEDHIGDELRYRVRSTGLVVGSGTTHGYY